SLYWKQVETLDTRHLCPVFPPVSSKHYWTLPALCCNGLTSKKVLCPVFPPGEREDHLHGLQRSLPGPPGPARPQPPAPQSDGGGAGPRREQPRGAQPRSEDHAPAGRGQVDTAAWRVVAPARLPCVCDCNPDIALRRADGTVQKF